MRAGARGPIACATTAGAAGTLHHFRLPGGFEVSWTAARFRHKDGDDASRVVLERVNASGKLYISHCQLDGRYTLRFCIGAARTDHEHVQAAWSAITAKA